MAATPASIPAIAAPGLAPEAAQRLAAYWAGAPLDRPVLQVTVQRPDRLPPVWEGPADPRARDLTPAWHARQAVAQVDGVEWLAEAVPRAQTVFAANIPLLTALVGADWRYESGSAWVEELPDVYERPAPHFDPQHPLVRTLAEAMRLSVAAVGDRATVQPPAFGLDAVTALSLLRGAQTFCMDVIERPEEVDTWLAAMRRLWIDAARHFHGLARELGQHGTGSWLHLYAPGAFEAVQCDAAMMLSPAMFARVAMPELRLATEALDTSLYHLDGVAQMRFLPQLATLPRLLGIQWNPEPPANHIDRPEWIAAFRRIRESGLRLHFNHWESRTVEQVEAVVAALGPDGLSFALPPFATRAEAEAAIARIERSARR